MAEFGASASQTINPGESVIFTVTVVPPNNNYIHHSDGTGNVLLSGAQCGRRKNSCCCKRKVANFFADFGANIAVPTGQTVGEISVALAIDGATLPNSIMRSTPDAVEEFNNISRAINVPIWLGCCQTLTVRNTSSIPIIMEDANLVITGPDTIN